MPTETATVAEKRRLFVEVAKSQIGAHYVNGAAGNRPGENDGAWYRPSAVKLSPNYTTPGGPSSGRNAPIYQAAYCEVEGSWVCGGRCNDPDVLGLPKGDMNADIVLFDGYRWPRPEGRKTSSNVIWGESCEGVRHFDCIGFINWCLAQVGRRQQFSIKSIRKKRDEAIAAGKAVIPVSQARAGDILLKGTHHIGIADGQGWVVHASTYKRGVLYKPIINNTDDTGDDWDAAYRLSSYYFS